MSSMTIEQAIETVALRHVGAATVRENRALIANLASAYRTDGPEGAKRLLSYAGQSGYTGAVDEVTELVGYAPAEETEVESFDKATAAEVIRAFLIGEEGYSEENVTALLVLAGLEDEPVEEPVDAEPEQMTVDSDLFSRLLDFARSHGFNG